MNRNSPKSIWQILLLSGMLSVVFYTLHVVLGGVLRDGYSHFIQPISDLTATDAPNADILRIFTYLYGAFAVIFSFSLLIFVKDFGNKLFRTGVILFLIMELYSLVGYSLFPLDAGSEAGTFHNLMHIAVTAVVVITTIVSTFFMAFGLRKKQGLKPFGTFVLVCGVVIFISGIATAAVTAFGLQFTGLLERVNIFTLQIMVLVFSVKFFIGLPDSPNADHPGFSGR
jgi:hypothetical protein